MSGAEILPLIGLGLAAPGVIDLFVKVGIRIATKTADTLKQSRDAKKYALDLHMFLVPAGVERLELQMRRAQNVLNDPTVDEVDKNRLNALFDAIKSTLKHMDDLVDVVAHAGGTFNRRRRPALAALKEETVRFRDLLEDFRERISALRDLAASESDLLLTSHQFQWIASSEIPDDAVSLVPGPLGANLCMREGRVSQNLRGVSPEWRNFLYERMKFNAKNKTLIKSNVEIIAKKLDAAEKTDSGILSVLGYREDTQEDEFQLIFVIPKEYQFSKSLDKLLQESAPMPSLNFRLQICLQLAESLLHVHSVRLVHKSIRPDNIVVLSTAQMLPEIAPTEDGRYKFKVALMGWQNARTSEGFDTQRAGEQLWQRRIYQHPQRQRRVADAEYNIGHDIYSLGACMLETLRWKAYVDQRISADGTPNLQLSKTYVEHFHALDLEGRQGTRPSDSSEVQWLMQQPRHVQQVLLAWSRKELPSLVGYRLTNLVCDCLTRLDVDNVLTEDVPVDSSDRKEIGSDFVDRILKHILTITNAV
jgi:serine/threonine protein kinase